jgi:hypothetical protein
MFSKFLLSIVVAPVLLGILAARVRLQRSGMTQLLALVAAYDALFILLLYYLRYRWVG